MDGKQNNFPNFSQEEKVRGQEGDFKRYLENLYFCKYFIKTMAATKTSISSLCV